jgi:AbrB family looped-hinge helix DNA binding protein
MGEIPVAILQISKKGQILIPRKLRDKAGLKPGSSVQIIKEQHQLILKPVSADPIAAATGFLGIKESLTRDLLKEHKEEAWRISASFPKPT